MHKLKFTLDGNGFGVVTLDGNPIDVASLAFAQKAGEPNTVTMTIFARVEGEIEVRELTTIPKGKLSDQKPPKPAEGFVAPANIAPQRRPRLL